MLGTPSSADHRFCGPRFAPGLNKKPRTPKPGVRATLLASAFFQVPAKSVTHRGEQFVLVIRFAARGETLV